MKVALVTTTRAEYGILKPLIQKLEKDDSIDLNLLVTGSHLSDKYGNTQVEIEADEFPIYGRFPILTDGNTTLDTSIIMANALRVFARYFEESQPKCVIVLGDRTELLGICAAAMSAGVPIVHLHGGELTEGAIDDSVRHAITKLAYLHFPATETYRRRIIQMGENPARVHNVGALGVENILNTKLLSQSEVYSSIGIPNNMKYAVVTFHPVTMENGDEKNQVRNLICAMKNKAEFFYLITKANSDAGSDCVNQLFEEFAEQCSHVKLVTSLGMKRYLSAVKYSEFVLGNSSSGIIEAPSLGVPTVNIGIRQKGRIMADSVINCSYDVNSIERAIERASTMNCTRTFLYGNGKTSTQMVEIIKETFRNKSKQLRKIFYDINY